MLLKSPQWVRFCGGGFFIFRLKVWEILNHKLFLSLKTNFQCFFDNWALSLRSSSKLGHSHHHVHIWFTQATCNTLMMVWKWSIFLVVVLFYSYPGWLVMYQVSIDFYYPVVTKCLTNLVTYIVITYIPYILTIYGTYKGSLSR